jgi:hypothetical protein
MGSVFGKQTVAEPAFEIILNRRHHANAAYEIRRYGERFAAKVSYSDSGDMGSPFGALAKYIGSFGTPQNDGGEAISMTAPVVIHDSGTQISMTAPVVTEDTGNGEKVMKCVLPAKYDDNVRNSQSDQPNGAH